MQHNHLPSDHGQWAMDKDSTQLPIVDPPRMGAVEPTLGGLLIDIRTLVLGSSPRHVHEPTVRLLASTGRFSWPTWRQGIHLPSYQKGIVMDGYNHNDNN